METGPAGRLLRATTTDLPAPVAVAMASASPELAGARPTTVLDGGIPWTAFEWGEPGASPVLLVHGITSSANTFWRVGPALAAAGRRVVAVDLPGHGRTGHWRGRYRLADTSADLAGFIRASGLDQPNLAAIGHSWGARIVAGLPAAGIRPERLILLDPPALTLGAISEMTTDPLEQHYDSLASATTAVRATNPPWSEGDIYAKALALTQFDPAAFFGVILENGDWDGGLKVLDDPAARQVPIWLIRGEFGAGGMVSDDFVVKFQRRIGADHVVTIRDGPHSPQRTHPEATVLAILRALDLA